MSLKPIRKYKITGMMKPAELNALPFGRKIDVLRQIDRFKSEARSMYISQKRKSGARAIREFIDLYDVTEYYCEYRDGPMMRDDTFEIWYKTT